MWLLDFFFDNPLLTIGLLATGWVVWCVIAGALLVALARGLHRAWRWLRGDDLTTQWPTDPCDCHPRAAPLPIDDVHLPEPDAADPPTVGHRIPHQTDGSER